MAVPDQYKRGPVEPVAFNKLIDWTRHEDDRIKYFSGTAIYKTSFEVQEELDKRLFLDLGKVIAMAKIKVNGKYAGGVWTAPYRIDVTDMVKRGENVLEIEVSSTWMNRLIGDLRLPPEKRPTWAHHNSWNVDSPLQPSGLLGPVSLLSIPY